MITANELRQRSNNEETVLNFLKHKLTSEMIETAHCGGYEIRYKFANYMQKQLANALKVYFEQQGYDVFIDNTGMGKIKISWS